MRNRPRSIEEWLYYKLLDSPGFHRFVRRIYRKINGIKDSPNINIQETTTSFLYRPTQLQKFKAFRMLFWDEFRGTFGLNRKTNDIFNNR